jgi:hypothetical protein
MKGVVFHPDAQSGGEGKRRYKWPWLLLAAIVAATVLAVLWMSKEIERTRRLRDLNSPNATVGR